MTQKYSEAVNLILTITFACHAGSRWYTL